MRLRIIWTGQRINSHRISHMSSIVPPININGARIISGVTNTMVQSRTPVMICGYSIDESPAAKVVIKKQITHPILCSLSEHQ